MTSWPWRILSLFSLSILGLLGISIYLGIAYAAGLSSPPGRVAASPVQASGLAINPDIAPGIPVNQSIILSCPQPNITLTCPSPGAPPEPETPLFMTEARIVAGAHYYDRERYVCQDFAEELVRRLQADGYEAYLCLGLAKWCDQDKYDPYNCWHAWVKLGGNIIIEATTGQFILPKDYERDYDERQCSSDVE